MSVFIKICGITRPKDAVVATNAGADAVGFVAYPKSPRFADANTTRTVIEAIPADKRKVGVFVNAAEKFIESYLQAGVTTIQLHGDETPTDVERLKSRFPNAKFWKAIRPQTRQDVENATQFPVDAFLIDAFSSSARGGTGDAADWQLAALAVNILPKPVILAGGLNPDNVGEALKRVEPAGIDASSGLETSPGIKDSDKMLSFISKILEIDPERRYVTSLF